MTWELKYIHPAELHSAWDRIKPAVLKLSETSGGWWPEDVYASIKTGESQLYVCDPGFVVLTPRKDGYTNDLYVHVWLAYAEEHGAEENCLPEVEKMARNIGAKKVVMHSTRKGFARTGWTPAHTQYERQL